MLTGHGRRLPGWPRDLGMDWARTPAPFHCRAAAGVCAAAAQRLGSARDIATTGAIAAVRDREGYPHAQPIFDRDPMSRSLGLDRRRSCIERRQQRRAQRRGECQRQCCQRWCWWISQRWNWRARWRWPACSANRGWCARNSRPNEAIRGPQSDSHSCDGRGEAGPAGDHKMSSLVGTCKKSASQPWLDRVLRGTESTLLLPRQGSVGPSVR
jgi:hypothetical protein